MVNSELVFNNKSSLNFFSVEFLKKPSRNFLPSNCMCAQFMSTNFFWPYFVIIGIYSLKVRLPHILFSSTEFTKLILSGGSSFEI